MSGDHDQAGQTGEASLREQEEKLARTYAAILENPDRYHPVTVEWAKRHFGASR